MIRSGARWIAHVGAVLLVFAAALGGATSRAHAANLTRAFTDDIFGDPGEGGWIPRLQATGARLVLLPVYWNDLESTAPPNGTDPTNPAGPQFNFAGLDSTVRDFSAAGIFVALLVTAAPQWAEAPGGPEGLEVAGAWQPSPTAFGQLAAAIAKRYSGSYHDPLHPGQTLPRVKYFQAWAEANFSVHLAPQWTNSQGKWVNTGAVLYRSMLNAFYVGVKSVHSDNFVVTTGLGPYGDLGPGSCTGGNAPQVGPGCRTPPALFARNILCLNGQRLQPVSCPNPAHYDAMAIDPYEVGGPTMPAFNIDDVSVPDMGKLTRIQNKAVSAGRALPRRHKQLWVTEFGYDSNPPNRTAPTSLLGQARWMDQALYLFWQQGVSVAVWYLVRDQAQTYMPNTYYTGVYFYNGAPKPSLEAMRFPFVVLPKGKKLVAWGISPRSGKLTVQQQKGSAWKTLFKVNVGAGNVFVRNVPTKLRGTFRAVVGGETSLVWQR